MFELDQYQPILHNTTPAGAVVSSLPQDDIDRLSFLPWSEHCTECAAPACYQTCDLYQPRPDTRCRRFQFGMHKNHQFSSFRGYGVEISFKKWGVLAAEGNTAVYSRPWVLLAEQLMRLAAPAFNAIGPIVARLTKDDRWMSPMFSLNRKLARWMHVSNKGKTKPDGFLLELFNPGERARLQLSMEFAPEVRKNPAFVQIQSRFQTTLDLPQGYSRHQFDMRLFQSFAESGLPFMVSMAPEADRSLTLAILSADFVCYRNKLAGAKEPPQIKCVIWDLDNTVWDGVLLENDEVQLRPRIREILETLDSRGILSSIASKNTHELAWQRLEALGIAEYFLVPQIHWGPKSQSVRVIAQQLSIGIDSLAFIDDTPMELEEVRMASPEVACIDARSVSELLTGERFRGSKTDDARNRRRYYQEALVREEKRNDFGADYLEFLRFCEIQVELSAYQERDFERIAELVQRTNQLNFSGRKYTREQLRAMLVDSDLEKYILYCSDRFGSYGLIGFGMVRRQPDSIRVEDLMLSCRIQGKCIEQSFFSHLCARHNPAGASRIEVDFAETKRNQPARQALEAAGFTRLQSDGCFARDMRGDIGAKPIVTLKCSAGCENGTGAS